MQDLSEQLTWHWSAQLRPRLAGLDDREFFWEPAPEPAPVTTIGWRLCHLVMILAQRADFHFGERTLTLDKLHWPEGADDALATLDRAYASWTTGVSALSTAAADVHSEGPPGTIDAQFPLWAVVLHVNREVIHHGAEIALLRDLYRARDERAAT